MSIKHDQPDEKKISSDAKPAEMPAQFAGESRRRFTKAGLAASGVMVTLASRPVLGCATAETPSGFISGNVSRGQAQASCGLSPGYWKNHSDWPAPMVSHTPPVTPARHKFGAGHNDTDHDDGTLFSAVFDCTRSRSLPYAKIAMSDLLVPQSFDNSRLGAHCVAAYLNALAGMTPYLPAAKVVQMFNQWAATGYFYPLDPSTSVKWDAAQIVAYLGKTQD